VQFLPGRLEVLQGAAVAGQELRFIRPDDPTEQPTVTFGRGDGPPYRHVQLRAPTVSRMHARLTMQPGGTWTLENLSTTNPVVLNGTQISNGSEPQPLADGDRIEMGEVVFRFRQR
jgi:pSer/pThr/pTyr-binding forkhead associated (FHA) protein